MMLMIVNGFLLHYVGSLQWDLDILRKEMKPKKEKKRKRIQFDLNDANECEWKVESGKSMVSMSLLAIWDK